ncbi:MAG TPA: glycosyltransferase [Chloroflexota bacterium]|nr:glycosyltransferase [Chloroflexota bacterium]
MAALTVAAPARASGDETDAVQRREARRRTAAWFDRYAPQRAGWKARNRYYYAEIERLARAVVPPGARVLELGCGTGDLLAALRPALGVGVDISEGMVRVARARHPNPPAGSGPDRRLLFVRGDAHALPLGTTFDYVVLSDLLGHVDDIQDLLERLQAVCTADTRILITYWNFLWHGAMLAAERLGLKMPEAQQNWLGMDDVDNLLTLTDFRTLERGASLICPKPVPLLAPLLNRFAVRLPLARHLALVGHWVVRPEAPQPVADERLTCTVIVPCRNEEGNIADCVDRLPPLGADTELIFVDGASTDRTRERILEQIERHRGRKDIKLIDQVPLAGGAPNGAPNGAPANGAAAPGGDGPVKMLRLGKGDAVRKGFAAARGDVLFILDADLTVPPEDLPKFLRPIATGRAGFVNGTRLVYPLEDEAMRTVNLFGNKFFSLVFTWLLEQRIKDTLCGTKVLRKRDYDVLAANRGYFGDFDPFGDFDLLFGAARLGLPLVEVPVRYRRRTSGYSKVQVYKHGILLLRMSLIGFRRLKLQRWLQRASGRAAPPLVGVDSPPAPA